MDLRFSEADERFRLEVRAWLTEHLVGDFTKLKGRGWSGDMDGAVEERRAWERELAQAGWGCLGWPEQDGGRGLSLVREVIFNEEYVRADAPGRLGHIGETLMGPTLIAFGNEEQKRRLLPGIRNVEELWCQGYSEPNAGSDLANVQTRAELDGDEWVITGQKIWTSLAEISDWIFMVCRTEPGTERHKGLTFLVAPVRQPGIQVVPIKQMTGTSEFAEVFFDGARTSSANVIGEVGGGWKVAMGLLAFERGASTLAQQEGFRRELDQVIAVAKANGRSKDPAIRQRIADAWMGLKIMRLNALRTLVGAETAELDREAMITKLFWASWHRALGELAIDVLGPEGQLIEGQGYGLGELQRLFLWTRCDTIYGGTNEIQRNLIGERALGLPREPRP